MSYILVTNDDGVDSPALLPLVHALRPLGEIRVAVPARERSWIGKAISRWDELKVERLVRDGIELLTVDGNPADCTNLAVHSLFGARPELVVSGVNIGLNVGLGFFLSSGTVGAAMEGWIAGIPAIALSVGRIGEDREWKRAAVRDVDHPVWQRAARVGAAVVRDLREAGYPEDVDLFSVNWPASADVDAQRALTELAVVGYDRLFRKKSESVYVHDFDGALRDVESVPATSDIAVVKSGRVSITPIRLAHTAQISKALRSKLERT
ncbi:MAG TPA: 5'/3'-nucleotidase SurE [Myxococcota bacterium]|nr:5'/3'-nucleotidase SurE [Myxococcota bacterium]